MAMKPEVDFGRVALLCKSEAWTVIQEGDVRVSHGSREAEKSCIVRIDFEVDLPLKYKTLTLRPEFMCEHSQSTSLLDLKMVRELGPCDAIVSMRLLADSFAHAVNMLVGGHYQEMRYTYRRDWPLTGQCTAILSSPDPTRGLEGFSFLSYCIVLSELKEPDPNRCMITHLFEMPWPSYPLWATPLLIEIGRSEIAWARMFNRTDLIESAEGIYVVLGLQSCTRGPPLLPCRLTAAALPEGEVQDPKAVAMGGFVWSPAQHDGFNFPDYLRQFLKAIGLSAPVWDSLDGRRLVPYQACLQGRDWQRVEKGFSEFFRLQGSAYRRLNGGKSAPKAKLVQEPSYLEGLWAAMTTAPDVDFLEERNTFINLCEPLKIPLNGLQTRRISAEYP